MPRWIACVSVVCLLLASCIKEGAEVPEGVPGIGKKEPKAPLIGDKAPAFEAEATTGPVKFPDDFAGRWVVLFSHPGAYSPVCTTEFMRFAEAADEFRKLHCALVALSADTTESHQNWLREVRRLKLGKLRDVRVEFPVVADPDLDVAKLYGMVHPKRSRKRTVRSVFVIDPAGVIRATMTYPPEIGRSVPEILRLVTALQTSDHFDVATPANWRPGDDVILKPLPTEEENRARARRATLDFHALSWFLVMKRLPEPRKTLLKVDWAAPAK